MLGDATTAAGQSPAGLNVVVWFGWQPAVVQLLLVWLVELSSRQAHDFWFTRGLKGQQNTMTFGRKDRQTAVIF